jgi:hypothetical protein
VAVNSILATPATGRLERFRLLCQQQESEKGKQELEKLQEETEEDKLLKDDNSIEIVFKKKKSC